MTPEEIKDLKIMLAVFKFDIDEIIEDKVNEILRKNQNNNKPGHYIERGYRE